jgi:S-DNA-T family DNA segregation ATPase FtsK/SpoIIIE
VLGHSGGGDLDDSIAIAARWRAGRGGDDRRSQLRAAIGVTSDGIVEVDLVSDGPHALIAGTTGSGKSELLRSLVASLAAGSSPDDLTFVLIDYKGGSTFDACADLPHTVGVVTDLDDRLAERALISLDAELRRREHLLRAVGADDLDSYRSASPDAPLPRLVVVIDEFAAMAAELPGFLTSLVATAQRGRSLGIHLVLATQRPAGVVSDEIRANTNLRIALRLQDRADAVDIVGASDPAGFPRGVPGRAMLRLGAGETVVFQAAHSSGAYRGIRDRRMIVSRSVAGVVPVDRSGRAGDRSAPVAITEIAALTRTIRAAASLCDIRPPFRPWLPPLPELIPVSQVAELGRDVVGVVDDPGGQRQEPLRWLRSDGNLALIGALGSGTTTALATLLVASGDAHCYIVDARGDGQLEALASVPTCGGVISLHDVERRTRLVRVLADELARRQADPSVPRQPIILAVDGLGALLSDMSRVVDGDDHARLMRVITDGVAAGIHTVATMERPGAVSHTALAALTYRWVFHLDDPIECVPLGVPARAVPPPIPGRIVIAGQRPVLPGSGRCPVLPGSGRCPVLEAQLAVLPVPRPEGGASSPGAPPAAIGVLAADIDADSLPASTHVGGLTALAIGFDFAALLPAFLEVPDGEHVLIVGPARSGRSTALIRVIDGWRTAHSDGIVVLHTPRAGSPAAARAANASNAVVVGADADVAVAIESNLAAKRPVLVAVDDAERVVDADGRLLELVNERHPQVMVVATGRPDSLRMMYGHWTAAVRRSRIGLVMSTGSDVDGDLLGEPLPGRSPVAPRAGLAWMIDAAGRRLVQVARHTAAAVSAGEESRLSADRHDTRLPLLRIERE